MEKNTLESALKEFSQTSGTNANDVKEFFALMSDGSIKRMPKEDMATVLGRLIPISAIKNRIVETKNPCDCDSYKQWTVLASYTWVNAPKFQTNTIAILEVIPYSKDWVIQRYTTISSNPVIYIRTYHDGTTWSDWTKIIG